MVAQQVGDEVVLVQLETNRIFTLNRTGARLWQLLRETGDRRVVEQRLREEFHVAADTLAREVDSMLEQLQRSGLVVPRGS